MHTLVGGGGQHGGYDALDYRKIRNGDAGRLGAYGILSVLPDKFVRSLFEFHSPSFTVIVLKASISPSYPQTEVILMCTEPLRMNRYVNVS